MGKFIDLTGRTFGRWKVIERVDNDKFNRVCWLCECQCEKKTKKIIMAQYLTSGDSKSCGCLNHDNLIKRNTTHGKSKSKLYQTWKNIKKRIYNKNSPDYPDYGGRGINLYKEWEQFEPFMEWALSNGYKEGLTIERKNVNKDYCPENCCWIPMKEQAKNKRTSKQIEFNGQIHILSDWSKITNIPYKTLMKRIYKLNWSVEKALTTPPRKMSK